MKDELGGDNIDFENRKIKWNEVKKSEKQIEFLSKILLQFVTRKKIHLQQDLDEFGKLLKNFCGY